jgi:hypothetical protein
MRASGCCSAKTGQDPVAAPDIKNVPGNKSVFFDQILQDSSEEHTVIKGRCQKAQLQILIPVVDQFILAVEIGRASCSIYQPFLGLVK